jgi:DNA-binding transcriptional ArsR family regulator
VHEIAGWLGVPESTLYEHLAALETAGLILEGESVRTTKNYARTYEAPASTLKITHSAPKPETRAAISDVVSSQLRLASREFHDSLVKDNLPAGTPDDTVDSGSVVGWLSERQIKEVNKLLGRVMKIYAESSPSESRQLHAITWVTRPASTSRRSAR